MIRDPSDGSVKEHTGPICKECGVEFYYDFVPRPNDYVGYCENCVPPKRPTSAENWGLRSLDREARKTVPAPTAEELKQHYSKFGLRFQKKEQAE